MNGFYLVGRIIGSPEKAETASGLPLCRLKLRVNKGGRDAEDGSEIFEVALFRSLAEADYQDGQMIAISGRLQANNFEKEDTVYYHVNLIGNSVTIVS